MNISPFIAELIGTTFLLLLGQGVVANVKLKKTIVPPAKGVGLE